jgi:cyanophycinase
VTGLLLLALAAPPPHPPAAVHGALVIVGGGRLPDAVRDEFVKLAGGPGKARLVVIPTASEDAGKPAEAEAFLGPWRKYKPAALTLLHKPAADGLAPLAEATGVWLSGGDQSRLTAAYRGQPVEAELRAVLKRGGVIGGTSAGAAVMSDPMITGGNPVATVGPGFGFLPGVMVDQHFAQRQRLPRLQGVLDKHPGFAGLGIDESTAVVVSGRTVRVLGECTVTACWAKSADRSARTDVLKAGERLDLFQARRAAQARATKRPPVGVPEVPTGSLVIAGGGPLPAAVVERFIALAGGKDAPLVVVPTAMEDPVSADPGEAKLLRRHGATNVTVLHTRDRPEADDPAFSQVLTKAKGVWFGGGRQWRFVDSYEGTLTEKRFREVLARGGVIGGSSAGASIQGEYMPRGHPLGNAVVMAEGYERGFGYLPGVAIDQHFFKRNRLADMTGLMTARPDLLGVGIDEGTALVVTGRTAEVVGASKVAFYDWRAGKPAGETDQVVVPAGGRYDLVARKPLGEATPDRSPKR